MYKMFANKSSIPWFSLSFLLCWSTAHLGAQDIVYFDVNGSDPGFGIVDDATYEWFAESPYFWNPLANGTGTPIPWNNANGDIASFEPRGNTILLSGDVVLGGLYFTSGSTTGNIFQSSDSTLRTITFVDNGEIRINSRLQQVGDNINVVGDFTIGQISNNNGDFSIVGAGDLYQGTITINPNRSQNDRGLDMSAGHRFGPDTNINFIDGRIRVFVNTVLGELSGPGGNFFKNAGGDVSVTIRQDTDTVWGGEFGINNASQSRIGFIKEGTGSLTMTGFSRARQRFEVHEGSVYMDGTLERASSAEHGGESVLIKAGAIFGGSGNVNDRVVILESLTSILAPGSLEAVGTLTLGEGIDASSAGGTFRFRMNGFDTIEETTIHDLIEITGGDFLGGAENRLEIINLNEGNIVAGTPYALIAGGNITTDNWVVSSLPSGWAVGDTPFSIDDDTLHITFSQIPEPGWAAALLGGVLLILGIRFRRKR